MDTTAATELARLAYINAALVYRCCCCTAHNVSMMRQVAARIMNPRIGDVVIVSSAKQPLETRIGRLMAVTREEIHHEGDGGSYIETYYHVRTFEGAVTKWYNVHVIGVVSQEWWPD